MTQQFIKKIGQYSLFLLVFFRVCVAEVTFDNSLGDITRSADTLSGEITIPVARGDLNGRNLFHSFSTFNINANESVHFVGGTQVDTIISRVTGGDISHINGGLRTTDAHLFFLNPAGIMFGEGAMIDIDGSFHVSTADLIQFDDGSVFAADLSSSDANIRLTSAKPSAFGFLDTDPKAITIKNSDTFKVANHATLSMTGGAIEVTNGSELKAPGGIIQLTSLSGSGFIPINNTPINPDNFDDLGVITISDHSKLDVTGEGHTGGEIFLVSGEFTLKGESEINSAFIPNETNYSGPSINILIMA